MVVVGSGGPGHYVVTPTQVEVELRLSWAVTIYCPPVPPTILMSDGAPYMLHWY